MTQTLSNMSIVVMLKLSDNASFMMVAELCFEEL